MQRGKRQYRQYKEIKGNTGNTKRPLGKNVRGKIMNRRGKQWAYQHIPTRHIPTRWEYDMMIRGGNVTLSYSHHIYYIYHYMYVWVICLSS